ncbi:MAG: hypothetical protein HYU31_04920 [Deltaproteobacteria bacterium]|nr:hypothetical protein [Deltaproteobacteria bacterium]MBI2180144.1 hypothetical protein [Deltaproteobacteria bacterium]MBI2230869.1 hypothetical protein [Deltaproteobacteria bacterium]MBI2368337.1 hypothetical protein [Deltaproteobacteria bacterium]MBI3067241.1 hypothetical protein [Deltaproteobacteria bacterium]
MKLLRATLWIYAGALRRSWECAAKNWIVSFAPVVYGLIFSLAATLALPLGIIGGLLLGLVSQACLSSGLYLVKNIVDSGKATFNDFLNGFTVYLWELIGIAFILWIPMRLAAMVLASVPNGGLIYFLIQIGLYVLLNPVPEFIYQTRVSNIELIGASYNFIVDNWIEWLAPNFILTVAGYALLNLLDVMVIGLPGFLQSLIVAFAFGLCLTYFMALRGFLFAELHGTSRRSRIYRFDARA